MTSTELKHQARQQKWVAAIQNCRSSGLPVRQWCKQRGITPSTSNLLDNAIEACQQYDKGDKAIHVMAVAQQDFFISVRNTSEPVVIISGSIPTTKPEPQMHGFGLANIRLILEKYSGEYTMFYENGWFQFTADIPFTPIS